MRCFNRVGNKTTKPSDISPSSYPKPRQEALEKQIKVMETELNCLVTKRDTGMAGCDYEKSIKKMRIDLDKAKKKLKDKQSRADWQKEYRQKQRANLQSLKKQLPDCRACS